MQDNPESLPWTPHDCGRCPVPEILQANASQNLRLKLNITSSFLGIKRQVEVSASCSRHHIPLDDPYIGCPLCNDERPGLDIFRQALDQRDDEE